MKTSILLLTKYHLKLYVHFKFKLMLENRWLCLLFTNVYSKKIQDLIFIKI